jgi:hypothetical protein
MTTPGANNSNHLAAIAGLPWKHALIMAMANEKEREVMSGSRSMIDYK